MRFTDITIQDDIVSFTVYIPFKKSNITVKVFGKARVADTAYRGNPCKRVESCKELDQNLVSTLGEAQASRLRRELNYFLISFSDKLSSP